MVRKYTYNHDWGDKLINPEWAKLVMQVINDPFCERYLDRYRDPKDIEKEVLLKRLKTIEPFKEEPPMSKYPCLHKPEGYRYSWQRQDFKQQRLRQGKYRSLRPHSVYPQEDDNFSLFNKS